MRLFNPQKNALATKISNDLSSGEIVYVDDEPYRKVKIRLVDTWNGDTEKHIDRLEHTIDEQAKQIVYLEQRVQQLSATNVAMQGLNINLTNDCKWYKKHEAARFEITLEMERMHDKLNDLVNLATVKHKESYLHRLSVSDKITEVKTVITQIQSRQKHAGNMLLHVENIRSVLDRYINEDVTILNTPEERYQRLKHNFRKLVHGLDQIRITLDQLK